MQGLVRAQSNIQDVSTCVPEWHLSLDLLTLMIKEKVVVEGGCVCACECGLVALMVRHVREQMLCHDYNYEPNYKPFRRTAPTRVYCAYIKIIFF